MRPTAGFGWSSDHPNPVCPYGAQKLSAQPQFRPLILGFKGCQPKRMVDTPCPVLAILTAEAGKRTAVAWAMRVPEHLGLGDLVPREKTRGHSVSLPGRQKIHFRLAISVPDGLYNLWVKSPFSRVGTLAGQEICSFVPGACPNLVIWDISNADSLRASASAWEHTSQSAR
ncbi:unnamed protein product [Merluccius merluccius]